MCIIFDYRLLTLQSAHVIMQNKQNSTCVGGGSFDVKIIFGAVAAVLIIIMFIIIPVVWCKR